MRFNAKKTKSMVVSQSRTSAHGYGNLTLGGVELEEVKTAIKHVQYQVLFSIGSSSFIRPNTEPSSVWSCV